jgi:hypothetical protein
VLEASDELLPLKLELLLTLLNLELLLLKLLLAHCH